MFYEALRLYFENPVARLFENQQGQYAVAVYKPGKRKLSDLQDFLNTLMQLLEHRGWNKLLGDQRQMAPFTPEEIDWVAREWMPHGQTVYAAILRADNVFARLASSRLAHEAGETSLKYSFFEDESTADTWLLVGRKPRPRL